MFFMLMIHYFVYKFSYTLDTISNVFFIVGIMTFWFSLFSITYSKDLFKHSSVILRSTFIFRRSIEKKDEPLIITNKSNKLFGLMMFFDSIALLLIAYVISL